MEKLLLVIAVALVAMLAAFAYMMLSYPPSTAPKGAIMVRNMPICIDEPWLVENFTVCHVENFDGISYYPVVAWGATVSNPGSFKVSGIFIKAGLEPWQEKIVLAHELCNARHQQMGIYNRENECYSADWKSLFGG